MNNSEDCYYIVELKENEKSLIRALCVNCYAKIKKGWFYSGSTSGYGNWDITCHNCDHVIHRQNNDQTTV